MDVYNIENTYAALIINSGQKLTLSMQEFLKI